jgi:8-oxo-dGTP pyrophosphatase MutT (NUDIX family)
MMSLYVQKLNPGRKLPAGAGMVLVNKHRQVLLVQGAETGKWSFPKGHLEKGESPIQTALREFYEETGLNLKKTPHRILANKNIGNEKYYRFYGIVLKNEEDAVFTINRPNEILKISWKSLEEIQELHNETNYYIRESYEFMKQLMNTYEVLLGNSCCCVQAVVPASRASVCV